MTAQRDVEAKATARVNAAMLELRGHEEASAATRRAGEEEMVQRGQAVWRSAEHEQRAATSGLEAGRALLATEQLRQQLESAVRAAENNEHEFENARGHGV